MGVDMANNFGGKSFVDYQKFLAQEQSPIQRTEEEAASDLRTKQLMHRVTDNDELIRKALFLGMLDNGMLPGMNGIAQVALMRALR